MAIWETLYLVASSVPQSSLLVVHHTTKEEGAAPQSQPFSLDALLGSLMHGLSVNNILALSMHRLSVGIWHILCKGFWSGIFWDAAATVFHWFRLSKKRSSPTSKY